MIVEADKQHPLVSICIPTYNGATYLEAAIRSALSQTWKTIEIVISDDGSSDQTLAIARRLLRDSSLSVRIVNHKASTLAANWNHCANIASGHYIKYLFQDDLLADTCVEKMARVAMENAEVGMVFCERNVLLDPADINGIDLTGHQDTITDLHKSLKTLRRIQPGKHLLRDPGLLERNDNNFGEPTAVLLDRRLLLDAGGFNGSYRQFVDIECWLRLMPRCYVGFVNERLCTFRIHARSLSVVNMARRDAEAEGDLFYQRLVESNLFQYFAPEAQSRALKRSREFRLSVRRQLYKDIGARLWYSIFLPAALFPRNCVRRLYRAVKQGNAEHIKRGK